MRSSEIQLTKTVSILLHMYVCSTTRRISTRLILNKQMKSRKHLINHRFKKIEVMLINGLLIGQKIGAKVLD